MVGYFFNLTHKNKTNAHDTKLNPETILNNKSGRINKLYKNAIAVVKVHNK
jgi:hypothetical protein